MHKVTINLEWLDWFIRNPDFSYVILSYVICIIMARIYVSKFDPDLDDDHFVIVATVTVFSPISLPVLLLLDILSVLCFIVLGKYPGSLIKELYFQP